MTDNVEEEMEEAEDGNADVEVKVDTNETVDVRLERGGEPELEGKHCDDTGGHEKAPGSRLLSGEEGAGYSDYEEDGQGGEDGVCVQPRHPLHANAASEPGVVAGGERGLNNLGFVPRQ